MKRKKQKDEDKVKEISCIYTAELEGKVKKMKKIKHPNFLSTILYTPHQSAAHAHTKTTINPKP